MTEPPKFSFSFAKTSKKPTIKPLISENKPIVTPVDYVTSFEDNVIHSTNPEQKEEQLVIPLVKSKRGINYKQTKPIDADSVSDDLTKQAINALLAEGKGLDETSKHDSFAPNNVQISTATTDAEVEPVTANYDEMPVEKFGMALLCGMGFKPDLKADKEKSFEHGSIRPKGLGLGADPAVFGQKKKVQSTKNGADSEVELKLKQNAKCLINTGKHRGFYGVVDGIDGDTGRVVIRLTLSREIINVPEQTLTLVSEQEYKNNSRCINKESVDAYKQKDLVRMDNLRNINKDPDGAIEVPVNDRKRKHNDEKTNDGPLTTTASKNAKSWLKVGLIVRIMDKNAKDGKFYKKKVRIINLDDVESDKRMCTGQLIDSEQIINNLKVMKMQTTIPKCKGDRLMVVGNSSRNGEIAEFMEFTSSGAVKVKMNDGETKRFSPDDVCAFV